MLFVPSTLGATGEDVASGRDRVRERLDKLGDGIHGAHGGLDHREAADDVRVARLNKVLPGLGEERVLDAAKVFVGEDDGLVGDLVQLDDDGLVVKADLGN